MPTPQLRKRRVGSAVEPEVAAYVRAAGAVPNVAALSAFVSGCKADGTWPTLDWVWPMQGASLQSALVPLKAPRSNQPLSNANCVPTDYNPTLGLTGNGTNKRLFSTAIDGATYSTGNFFACAYITAVLDQPVASSAGFVIGFGNTYLRYIEPQPVNTVASVTGIFKTANNQSSVVVPLD
jgi:hypothetical protein